MNLLIFSTLWVGIGGILILILDLKLRDKKGFGYPALLKLISIVLWPVVLITIVLFTKDSDYVDYE